MAFAQLFRFVFVLYCLTVGVALLLAPWTLLWDRTVALLPVAALRWLSVPVLRGALSGFGLVHLVWGIHDLSAFLRPPHDEGSQTPGDQ
ncbi:MAG TPA: hypothetical protein VGG06_16400 [Thermoanaerobaculia bacterium]|jgi:hypothetical protein